MGGVPPTARAVVEAKKALAARGMELRTGVAGGAAGFDPGFSTALVPGSSVGELFMLGDFWYGGVGTTTYTTADGVLAAFGHPAMWDAGLSAFMTNADVVALWNSAESPYKVVAPGAVRGTIALDSGPGIAGRIGDAPEDVPMTVAVTDELTGRTTSTTSHATQWAIDQHKWPYPYLNSLALLPAFWQATGDSQYDGQITYDLTIGLSDGVDDFTYHRTNIWQDDYGWDAPSMLWIETLKLLGELTFDQDGTVNAHITSIDIAATVSPELTSTRVADVDVAGGIKTGINQVDVTLYAHGSTTPTTVTVPLTIPDGMSRKGTLYAKAPFHAVESMGDGWYGYWGASTGDSSYPPATLTDVVDQLNDAPANDELIVAYAPPESYNEDWIGEPWGDDAVVTGVDLDVYVRGAVQKSVAGISLYPMTWNPVAGRPFALEGSLEIENAAGKKVKIYSREVGETTDTLVTEVTVGADSGQGSGDDESGGSFVALIPKLRHTCTITAVYEGDDDYLYSSESIDVEVRARARLGATLVKPGVVRITASVSPSQTDATIDPRFVIERRVNGTWKKFRVLVATHPAGAPSPSSITTLLELKPGTYVLRNRFMGTDLNTAAVSKPVTVVVN
jgi:hypothetical protein